MTSEQQKKKKEKIQRNDDDARHRVSIVRYVDRLNGFVVSFSFLSLSLSLHLRLVITRFIVRTRQ